MARSIILKFFHMYESQNSLSLPAQDSEEVYWFYNYSNNLKYWINMGLVYLPLWIYIPVYIYASLCIHASVGIYASAGIHASVGRHASV